MSGMALQVREQEPDRDLKGSERAALLLLALGDQYGAAIWERLDEVEIRQVSVAMSNMGPVSPDMLENLFLSFAKGLASRSSVTGNYDSTERLLRSFLDDERVGQIMEEIRGPAGRNIWEKLSNVQETVLASYLKNEFPQTVAVVLSKIKSDHAGRVLAHFSEEFALEVVQRMLRMDAVRKDVVEKVERTLQVEFMSTLTQTQRRDAHEQMADIFNSFDRQTEAKFMTALEEQDRDSAERIKNLMFTFEDLAKLEAASIQTVLRGVDKGQLAIALKGATDKVREFFFQNMSQRAAKLMQEDMEALGPVRLKDVDAAQSGLINTVKDLAAKGEITINKNQGEDELVY